MSLQVQLFCCAMFKKFAHNFFVNSKQCENEKEPAKTKAFTLDY